MMKRPDRLEVIVIRNKMISNHNMRKILRYMQVSAIVQMHKNFGLKIFFGFLILTYLSVVDTEELRTCQGGEQTTVYDKIPDYKEVVLLFYTHETISPYRRNTEIGYKSYWYTGTYSRFNLTGVLLSNEEEFSVTISSLNETNRIVTREPTPWDDVSIIPSYETFDIFYHTSKFESSWKDEVSSISKNGFMCTTIRHAGKMVKCPVIDWETSNVYYISKSQIKECDKNIVMCVDVKSKFIKHPVSLTISQKNKQLFWIEKVDSIEYGQLFHLYKYDITNGSSARIAQDLKSSKWLTVDTARDRVYWMGVINNVTSITSTSFDGLHRHTVLPGIPIPKNSSSFAVHDNILYWPDKKQNKIMKCPVDKCEHPTVFKSFSSADYLDFDYLVLDHRHSVTSKKSESSLYCSHFRAESESTLNCYCPNFQSSRSTSVGQNNPFCVDETVVAIYKNLLYVIGLVKSTLTGQLTPIIHRVELNISSISALAYTSMNGSIIVAEMEKQRFYSWLPQGDGEIELIIDNGPGNVEVLCVDDLTNNLYWIDPTNHSITVVNLNTRNMVNVFKGNSSYSPFGLLLVSEKGYMFVSVLKNNSSIVIERISMDGQLESRKIIREIYGARIGDVFLYYKDIQIHGVRDLSLDSQRLYCLFDRRRNEIKYYTDTYSDFVTSSYLISQITLDTIDGIKDIVFYYGYLLISGNNGNLTLVNILRNTGTTIDLGIPRLEISDGILRVIPIPKSNNVYNSHAVECLRSSYGDCELNEVCLNTENYPSFICVKGTGKNAGGNPVADLVQPPQSLVRSKTSKGIFSFTTLEMCALIILPTTIGVVVSGAILWYIFWKRHGEERKYFIQLSEFRGSSSVSMEEETCLSK